MDAYPDDHRPKGKMIIAADFKILKMVVIQDTVIYPFTGRTFTVNGFVLVTIPWNTRMEPEVGTVLYIDSPSITAPAALRREGTLSNPVACKGAAVFLCILVFVISPATHVMAGSAQRMGLFIQGDIIRKPVGGTAPFVDIDQGIYVPVVKLVQDTMTIHHFWLCL